MTGFKSGASDDDPLGADGDEADNEDVGVPESTAADSIAVESIDESPVSTPSELQTEHSMTDGLPWIYRRNSITDGRMQTVQLHLQQTTVDREHKGLQDVPLNDRPEKADLREAAYLVGLTHLDEVATVLESWGYDQQ